MSNNLLTISMITNEALMVLENELTFSSEVDRNYDDQFAVTGAKIGNFERPQTRSIHWYNWPSPER
jgi:hypothetical protein